MKPSKLFQVLVALLTFTTLPLHAFMLPEDTIGVADWNQWTHKEKVIFITGFRVGTGPEIHSAPATTDKPLILSKDEYEEVVKRLDSFYGDKANKDVAVRGAIEVILMQMRHVPAEAVAKKLELERTRKLWGF